MLGFTRRHLFIALATILCIAGISWVALAYFFPSPPSKFAIAGSFPGGHYERLAHEYKEILARSHVTVEVRTTAGAVDNLKLLQDPNSGIQIGFSQGGISNSKQAPDLLSLGRINHQPFWLFHRVTEPLEDLTELKGKRIALGPVGSGTRAVTERFSASVASILKPRRWCLLRHETHTTRWSKEKLMPCFLSSLRTSQFSNPC